MKNKFLKFLKIIIPYFVPYKIIDSYKSKYLKLRNNIIVKKYYNNPIPFSPGYLQARSQFIQKFVASSEMKSIFKDSPTALLSSGTDSLNDLTSTKGFGLLFDERVVEYPWILSRLYEKSPTKLLDIGPVLNHEFCINEIKTHLPDLEITMMSLTPDARCYYDRSISYLISDIRSSGIRDNYFDCITCISTLEHIGMDNTKYGAKKEFNKDDYIVAVREMLRILSPGGSLFITVPFGKYGIDVRGSQQRFNVDMLKKIAEISSKCSLSCLFFKYLPSHGWIISCEEDCVDSDYNSDTFDSIDAYRNVPVRAESIACISIINNL